ncbi:hypothetical protein U1Q18_027885 [Sarracenia purpurea var. burkii]
MIQLKVWEPFEFNSDAPLDHEEIEATEDDAALVKRMGHGFRFSAVEARRMASKPPTRVSLLAVEASVTKNRERKREKRREENCSQPRCHHLPPSVTRV